MRGYCITQIALIRDFLEAPSEFNLGDFTKDQLLEIAKHYKIPISSSIARLKDNLVTTVTDGLVSREVEVEGGIEYDIQVYRL